MKQLSTWAVLLFTSLLPWVARAATCTISATTMNFGTYMPTASTTSTSTLTVNCPSGATYAVSLSAGTSSGSSVTSRRVIQNPGGYENSFTLSRDAARTLNWGQTVGTDTLAGVGTGSAQAITVYGYMASAEYGAPGTYNDTITASVSGAGITTVTTNFTVTVLVQAACAFYSTTNLSFGTYTGLLVNATSSLTLQCTDTTPYNVGLNAGNGAGATVTNREMTGPGSSVLNYALFQDAARSINWGNTVGTDTESGTDSSPFGVPIPFTVYGQLAAGQFSKPGAYSDVIIATVTF
jgi:spore coat protein U-like protein